MTARDRQRLIVRIDADVDNNSRCRSQLQLVCRVADVIQPFLHAGTSVILLGARGRPVIAPRDTFARIRSNNASLQLQPFAESLAQALEISAVPTLVSMPTVQIPGYRLDDRVTVLENLALDPREARNDQVLARQLAALGDRYIIDDGRTLNERTSSIASMPKAILTELSDLLKKEFFQLDQLVTDPVRPLIAVIGGSQVARKLDLIRRLGSIVDELLVVGEVANTFLAARGLDIKRTVIDQRQVDAAKQLGGRFENKLILPTDFVWRGGRIMDIGPQSRGRFAQSIARAATVLLTGPAGVVSVQLESFHHGTAALIAAIRANTAATRLVIGDDTLNQLPIDELTGLTLIRSDQTALDYLATGKLVGLDAIRSSRFSATNQHNFQLSVASDQ